jgi:uncharacterized OsmC-like protein
MKYSARVENKKDNHQVTLKVGENRHSIDIAPRDTGFGSGISGGELLFLALATCYCNDIYREAAKKNIKVESVEVDVEGDFPAAGEPARNIVYKAKVVAEADRQEIHELMKFTDTVVEIQNTLRIETPVVFTEIEAVSVQP